MVDYDSGYTVEEEYKHADEENGMRKVRAIISQLKALCSFIVLFVNCNECIGVMS